MVVKPSKYGTQTSVLSTKYVKWFVAGSTSPTLDGNFPFSLLQPYVCQVTANAKANKDAQKNVPLLQLHVKSV